MQTPVSSCKRPRHPLLDAGLIPEEMADILELPQSNEASSRKRTKRITGARNLTAEDYRNMLLADKEKKEKLEEEKRKKKEERERKKQEKEKKKETPKRKGKNIRGKNVKGKNTKGKNMKGKKKQKQVEQFSSEVSSESEASERASGPSRASDSGRPRCPREESAESDEDIVFSHRASGPSRAYNSGRPRHYSRNSSESDEDVVIPSGASGPRGASSSSGRPRRQCQLPSRFRDDNADDNDGALCMICNKNEPDNIGAEIIFWIDCSVCGQWAHNVCVFGSNTVTRQYTCHSCT